MQHVQDIRRLQLEPTHEVRDGMIVLKCKGRERLEARILKVERVKDDGC